MTDQNQYDILKGHLADQGRTEAEIEVIMEKLVEYDKKVARDSIFDSIEVGTFDLEGFVAKVLEEHDSPDNEEA